MLTSTATLQWPQWEHSLKVKLQSSLGPIRSGGYEISNGWTGEEEWEGYVQPYERPYTVNPEKGFIVAANGHLSSINTTSPAVVFGAFIARASRIHTMLEEMIQSKLGKLQFAI